MLNSIAVNREPVLLGSVPALADSSERIVLVLRHSIRESLRAGSVDPDLTPDGEELARESCRGKCCALSELAAALLCSGGIAWRGLGENCAKYLAKGKKAAIVGELQARTYTAKDGTTRISLDVGADEVEFLSPKDEEKPRQMTPADPEKFDDISSDDLPFD